MAGYIRREGEVVQRSVHFSASFLKAKVHECFQRTCSRFCSGILMMLVKNGRGGIDVEKESKECTLIFIQLNVFNTCWPFLDPE